MCKFVVGNDGSSIIDDNVSTSECLAMLSLLSTPNTCFVSTVCSAPVLSINDDENAVYIMMTAQRKSNKISTLHSFHKKVNPWHDKCYENFMESFDIDGIVGGAT